MSQLATAIRTLAESPVLLIASDFDGTISYVVSHPDEARPLPRAVEAFQRLASLPHTHVAVISGRARDDLRRLLPEHGRVRLIGSHGIEPDSGASIMLTDAQRRALAEATESVGRLAADHAGCVVECKPAGVALHYRNCSAEVGSHAHDAVITLFERLTGVTMRFGNKIVELSVIPGGKGQALAALRYRVGARAAAFLGDDLTDENAFASLSPGDLSVVVGTQASLAEHRVATPDDVVELLEQFIEHRTAWLATLPRAQINHHSLLSDQRTAAIVDPLGCITWLCLPRLDSPAVFASLIGGAEAGRFAIESPDDAPPIGQSYETDSMVLVTRWPTFQVTDYLDCSGGRPFQRPGRHDLIRVIEGSGAADIVFAPRLDFGAVETRLRVLPDGLEILGSPEPMVLRAAGIEWAIRTAERHDTAQATVSLDKGPVVLELRYGTAALAAERLREPERRRTTTAIWRGWSASLRRTTVAPELVARSALVLKALSYGPSGAVAAAATTSLPEHMGGVRNWDYRFCWPRDASMAAAALVRLGNTGIALRLCDWLLAIVDECQSPDRLRPIYTLSGGHLGPEAELNALSGYAGSRPVRVGNAAAQQVQLDVFGAIADLVAMLGDYGAPITPDHWRLVQAMAQAVEARWQEPDHGIWEIRGPRRHHVHSKVMCWLTLDRALRVQMQMGFAPTTQWAELRDRIRDDVLTHGWNPRVSALTAAYDSFDLDAASLWAGLSGMLAMDDERFASTVGAIERELRRGPTVYRYRVDDGLPGIEGGFHICTSWLIESYVRMGRLADARALFDEWTALVGPTGLLSEEHDPDLQMALGNVPQAYSHLALINAALALEGAA